MASFDKVLRIPLD